MEFTMAESETKTRFTDVVKLGDFHVPFHDQKAIDVAFAFIEFLDPQYIILDELLDWYQISRFDKDPKRIDKMQDDLDTVIMLLDELRQIAPAAVVKMVKSNHDERLRKYKWSKAAPFNSLRALKFEEMLELRRLGIEYLDDWMFRGVLFKHGSLVRKHSGYTAHGEFEKEDVSGVSGHTHRLGKYYTTKRGGKYVWVENGCLCDLKPEYIQGIADWQLGLANFRFMEDSKHFHAYDIPIIDYEILWGDHIITDRGNYDYDQTGVSGNYRGVCDHTTGDIQDQEPGIRCY
jgi:hypothetical protein